MLTENGQVDFYDLTAAALIYVERILTETAEHVVPQEAILYMTVRGPLHSLN